MKITTQLQIKKLEELRKQPKRVEEPFYGRFIKASTMKQVKNTE